MTKQNSVIKTQAIWENLYFYQKAKSLYNITFHFAHRFLKKGDRTIDQMIQAARSGKQNIVEGSADGATSSEMELKLLNVARSSIKELREDYEDYLNVRNMRIWDKTHPSFDAMLTYCRTHNQPYEYDQFVPRMSDEQIANMSITLCHMVDKMMLSYQSKLEKRFIEEGGIRERMTAARLGYRNNQNETIASLQKNIQQLQWENQQQKDIIASLKKQLANR